MAKPTGTPDNSNGTTTTITLTFPTALVQQLGSHLENAQRVTFEQWLNAIVSGNVANLVRQTNIPFAKPALDEVLRMQTGFQKAEANLMKLIAPAIK